MKVLYEEIAGVAINGNVKFCCKFLEIFMVRRYTGIKGVGPEVIANMLLLA